MTAFTTPRLTVRPWEQALAEAKSRALLADRLAAMLTPRVLEHLPPHFAPAEGPEAMSDWLDTRAARADVGLVEAGGTLIGLLFLFRPEPDGPRHIGYLLDEEAWGRGYATELVQGLVAGLRRAGPMDLKATVAPGNAASVRVLLKCGFTEEAPDAESGIRNFALRTS